MKYYLRHVGNGDYALCMENFPIGLYVFQEGEIRKNRSGIVDPEIIELENEYFNNIEYYKSEVTKMRVKEML